MALALLLLPPSLWAAPQPSASWAPTMFFDAEHSFFDRDGKHHIFEGNVVAIAAQTLVTADRLALDKDQQQFSASGHVLVLNGNQLLLGESLVYNLQTREFTLTQAVLIANDPLKAAEIQQQMLGFNVEELAFEEARSQRLQEIEAEKAKLRAAYRAAIPMRPQDFDELLERYVVLLEKAALIARQENRAWARLNLEKQEAFKRRREFWQQSRKDALAIGGRINSVGYFIIEGETIKSLSEERFEASEAFVTPCFCEADEKPAWGFRAKKIAAQGEAYADLYHAVLEVKGVPVFYLPFLKVPIKSKRQSGFLLPSLSHNQTNGTMYSQPVFFAFNEQSDATVTTDLIEKRGLRLGVEYRIQQKQHTGWQFHLEAIRDKLWLQSMKRREGLAERFQLGLKQAAVLADENPAYREHGLPEDHPLYKSEADPAWWAAQGLGRCLQRDRAGQCLQYDINNHLRLPSNAWRGQFDWHGQSIIAPRLSLVSKGMVLSDHRYQQDLWIPSITEFLAQKPVHLFAGSKARVHLDGKNFYVGLGSHFADPFLANDRFSGYQLPLYLKLQSRMFSLFNRPMPLSLYGQLSLDQKRIEVFRESRFTGSLADNELFQRLGNGNWRRFMFKINSPLLSEHIIQADYFAEFEHRTVEPDAIHQSSHYLSPEAKHHRYHPPLSSSYLHTARTGLHFNLPLDGSWRFPAQRGMQDADKGVLNLEHRMNWELTLALRPYAARRGEYGNSYQDMRYEASQDRWLPISGTRRLTYFPSDQTLNPAQEIIFATGHDWLTYRQRWELLPAAVGSPELAAGQQSQSLREQAKRELLYSLDRPVAGHESMFNKSGQWAINRYQLTSSQHATPLHVDASISFDYLKEKSRQKEKVANRRDNTDLPLTEAWSPLTTNANLNWAAWQLQVKSLYNLYNKMVTDLNFVFLPPSFYDSQLRLEYLIDKDVSRSASGDFTSYLTQTRAVSLHTDLLPHWGVDLNYGVKSPQLGEPSRKAGLGLLYSPPARCWGLRFAWGKDYEEPSWDGTYFLALVVNFLTHNREFGNFTSRFNQPEI